jgi:thioredoxin 1
MNGFIVARRSESHASAFEPHSIFRRLQFYETGGIHETFRRAMLLNGLSSCPLRGIRCAIGVVMLNKLENMNTHNDAGLVVVRGPNFKTEVLEAKLPVLVEFWTPWSRPCRILESVLQELARELTGKIRVVKVNADDSIDLSLWYDIQSVPTLICFVEGRPRWDIIGTASKEAIVEKLNLFGFMDETVTSAKGTSDEGRQPGKEN